MQCCSPNAALLKLIAEERKHGRVLEIIPDSPWFAPWRILRELLGGPAADFSHDDNLSVWQSCGSQPDR
jgi:hypothetical protein